MIEALARLGGAYWALFLELIRPKPVRDLIDTAWSTGSLAVDAFNNGLIDRMARKQASRSAYYGE